MDQAPEINERDTHFLMIFSISIGTILALLAVYIFGALSQLISTL